MRAWKSLAVLEVPRRVQAMPSTDASAGEGAAVIARSSHMRSAKCSRLTYRSLHYIYTRAVRTAAMTALVLDSNTDMIILYAGRIVSVERGDRVCSCHSSIRAKYSSCSVRSRSARSSLLSSSSIALYDRNAASAPERKY
jgi:hypothetical protein